MRPAIKFYRVLSDGEMEKIHDTAIRLLEDPGMQIENEELLRALEKKGARVDFTAQVVRFPQPLIEETIELTRAEEQTRRQVDSSGVNAPNQLTFSWHTPFSERTPKVQASLGGGAPLHYDHERKTNRYATRDDFLRIVRLAEGIPEIVTVGNAVHYLKEADGSNVPPKMVAIKGAALVATHSTKPGSTSIIDKRQLPYLMEIGMIVKGSKESYIQSPILVNVHDTATPLRLTKPEAAIIAEMARRRLPIFILPMPMAGISTPVTPISSAIVATAEILGVWAATKALRPDCPVQARCVAGVLNPKNGTAWFSAPETVLVDLAVAQLFRERYGNRCGTGVGNIDAPVPGPLSIFERTFKISCASLAGEPSFPVGIIGGAAVFSIEQIFLDLDIAAYQHQFMQGIGGNHFQDTLALIREQGIGGSFIATEHTAVNFRKCLMIPKILAPLKSTDVQNALANDPVELAHQRCKDILAKTELYTINDDRRKAIEKVVHEATKTLSSITGAME